MTRVDSVTQQNYQSFYWKKFPGFGFWDDHIGNWVYQFYGYISFLRLQFFKKGIFHVCVFIIGEYMSFSKSWVVEALSSKVGLKI